MTVPERMKAKIAIAKELRKQSEKVWDFRVEHFFDLPEDKRLKLAQQSSLLMSRADEVLQDALEEGAAGADQLTSRLRTFTTQLGEAVDNVEKVDEVIAAAGKVARVAAGVVAGGIPQAMALLRSDS